MTETSRARLRPTTTAGGRVASSARLLSRRVKRGILLEDRPLESLQIGAWLEPELVREQRATLAVHVERLGLSTRPVQGEHQLATEALA